MNFCQICKQPISEKDLNKSYQFTLGNMINGKFLGLRKQYIHVRCMRVKTNSTPKMINLYNQ